MDAADVMGQVAGRQLSGSMLHDRMWQAYLFMGMPAYAEQQRERCFEELRGYHRTLAWATRNLDRMVTVPQPQAVDPVPASWEGHMRQDLSRQERQRALAQLHDEWVSWEQSTHDWLLGIANGLRADGDLDALHHVGCVLRDVREELAMAKSQRLRLEASGWDMAYAMEATPDVHAMG